MNRRQLLTGMLLATGIGIAGVAAQAADPVRIGFSIAKTGLFAAGSALAAQRL